MAKRGVTHPVRQFSLIMADDEFSKQAGSAFQTVALGVAGLAGGPGGIAVSVGAVALLNIFDAVANANTQAFQEARIAALEDDVIRVRDEIKALQAARAAEGKPVEAPDAPSQAQIFSDFAEAVANAATPEKRTALVHAAAKQFDPDAGTLPVRKYWFNEVRKLTDMEVAALSLLQQHGALVFSSNDTLVHSGKANTPPKALTLLFTDRVAIENTIIQLEQRTKLVNLGRAVPGVGQPYSLAWFGHVVARFMGEATAQETKNDGE